MKPPGEYGFDAPYAPLAFSVLAALSGFGAANAWWYGITRTAMWMTAYSLFFAANVASFVYTTRRGKFVEWAAILDRLALRGDEQVLDLGCGRGAVLVAVARRLTTGTATGVDIWNRHDQSGNAREATVRNATLAGVSDRVRIDTGDLRQLPYAGAAFDVIVSSLAIHNIRANRDRQRAIGEAFRVLKPGGRLVIADIRATSLYEESLRSLGAIKISRRRLGWRFWWGNPLARTTLVSAVKPGGRGPAVNPLA